MRDERGSGFSGKLLLRAAGASGLPVYEVVQGFRVE